MSANRATEMTELCCDWIRSQSEPHSAIFVAPNPFATSRPIGLHPNTNIIVCRFAGIGRCLPNGSESSPKIIISVGRKWPGSSDCFRSDGDGRVVFRVMWHSYSATTICLAAVTAQWSEQVPEHVLEVDDTVLVKCARNKARLENARMMIRVIAIADLGDLSDSMFVYTCVFEIRLSCHILYYHFKFRVREYST
jgi:hypothetical protein